MPRRAPFLPALPTLPTTADDLSFDAPFDAELAPALDPGLLPDPKKDQQFRALLEDPEAGWHWEPN